jgi:hypothetical protein
VSDTVRHAEDLTSRLRNTALNVNQLAAAVRELRSENRVLQTALASAVYDKEEWMARALSAEALLELTA